MACGSLLVPKAPCSVFPAFRWWWRRRATAITESSGLLGSSAPRASITDVSSRSSTIPHAFSAASSAESAQTRFSNTPSSLTGPRRSESRVGYCRAALVRVRRLGHELDQRRVYSTVLALRPETAWFDATRRAVMKNLINLLESFEELCGVPCRR